MPRGAQPKIAERESRMIYAAIKLFLENGYEQTTTVAIAQAAGMSSSAFFAVFANKEALLLKLTKWMYEKQFAITGRLLGEGYEPEMFYAVEPSIQLYIAEKSEALRELYVSSYSYAATANYIHQMATDKLVELFGAMHPQYTRQDFYELELASSGMVRSFMARKCDRNFTMEQKLLGGGKFFKTPNGGAGVQHRGQLIYTYGVCEGRLTLEDMVKYLSYNPSRLFGMPDRGEIAEEKAADIVIWDPSVSGTITDTNHAYNCDNSVFAGFDVKGAARHVIINGEHIVENGSIKLEGRGRYISRTGYMKLR